MGIRFRFKTAGIQKVSRVIGRIFVAERYYCD